MAKNITEHIKTSIVAITRVDLSDDELRSISEVVENSQGTADSSELIYGKSDPGNMVFVDVVQLVTGLSGVVAGIAAISLSADFVAVTAFVASLGALRGFRSTLPREQGTILLLLIEDETRQKDKNDLKLLYENYIRQHPHDGASIDEFEDALIELKNLGCIRIKGDQIRLSQRIIL